MQNYLLINGFCYEAWFVESDNAIVETEAGQRSIPVICLRNPCDYRVAINIEKPVAVEELVQQEAEPALSSQQLTREQHLLLDAKHQMEWMQRELDTLRIRVKAYDDIISVVKQQRYNDGCGVGMGTSPAFAIDEYFKERDAKNYQELKAKADGNGSQKVSR